MNKDNNNLKARGVTYVSDQITLLCGSRNM